MKTILGRILAVGEVFSVVFIGVPLLTLGIYRVFPGFDSWQTEVVGFAFPVFVDVVMVILSLLVILLRRKKLADYGLRFTPARYHLDIAAACFIPFVLAGIPLGLGLDHTTWSGGLILAAVQIGLLFLLAALLRKKPSWESTGLLSLGLFLVGGIKLSSDVSAWKPVAVFLTYFLFVGFGEEIIYRGYMQSRLNEVFGRPYRFFGVAFGWGAILTALFFGLTHVGLLSSILGISGRLTWAWGFWTFFGGLAFGYVREKSGGILAGALLHGLPQAIASAALLMIA